jgi:hypothetical protein
VDFGPEVVVGTVVDDATRPFNARYAQVRIARQVRLRG